MLPVLLRFRLRRDRLQLAIWTLALFALLLVTASAMTSTYPHVADRVGVLRIALVTPALLVLRGTPQGTSLGDITVFEIATFQALLIGLMSTFLVVRNSRAEEDRGTADALAATAAGRALPTVATLLEAVVAALLAAVGSALGLIAGGRAISGSIVFGVALGAAGLAFAGLALLVAQIVPTGRAANGWSTALVLAAYALRGIGDATGTPHAADSTLTPGWASALSPIGWVQATRPYASDDLRPALLAVLVGAVAAGVALAVQRIRDVGAGLVPEGRRRPAASLLLRGPIGLAARQLRGSVIGWGVGALLLGALGGDLANLVLEQLGKDPAISRVLVRLAGGTGGLVDGFIGVIGAFVGMLAAAIAVQGALRLRQEEAAGGADAVLSGAVGRIRWLLSVLLVAAGSAAVALVLAGIAAGATAVAVRPDGAAGTFGAWFGTIVWELPAVLVVLGVVALVFALVPRATIPLGWLLLVVATFLGEFAALLDLPQWLKDLAPFSHSPAVALADPSFTGAWWMTGIAVVAVAIAALALRRRDTVP
ncbi:hypothetical protein [Amnibacterium sp.]|uniref:hypothetical protein n=1 Tax=Amnibacterium sp. TaxID=1872496 RepID=UPI002636D680|nr:hypothetical protein [Amnibacterium sp.]MCU1475230.1 polyketide antibiotic transporter [Amnibacterium sp.]